MYPFGIFQASAGLLELLGELVFDVLQVVQLHLLVVHLFEQFVVLHLQTLSGLSQLVHVLVQILHLALRLARHQLEFLRRLLSHVLQVTIRASEITHNAGASNLKMFYDVC